jgi:hypothetical protein
MKPPASLPASGRGRLEHGGRLRVDQVVGAHVDDHTGSILAAGEEVGHMPALTALPRPQQPEWLGGEPHDLRVEVQQHHDVAFQPRLIADMLAGRRRPPETRVVPLSLERRE